MKIVLTAGPSSGKSTLLKMMKDIGYSTIPEVAKDVITRRGIANPNDVSDYLNFQNELALEQIKREMVVDKNKITILDRGVYDILAYCEAFLGFVPGKVQKIVENHEGYDRVFLLERLPFVKKDFRVEENESQAIMMHEKVAEVYSKMGYNLEMIPALPKQERLEYLLEKLK